MLATIEGRLVLVYAVAVEILGHLANISGLLSNISTFLNNLNLAATLATLQTTIDGVGSNQLSGFATITGDLADIQDTLRTLQAQVGQPQQSGIAVRLPTTPPAGYGAPSSGTIADDVWAFRDPNTGQPTVDLLADAGLLAINMTDGLIALPNAGNPPWMGAGSWTTTAGISDPTRLLPSVDYTTIHQTDVDITHWLNRAYPGFGIFDLGNGWAGRADGGGGFGWVFGMSPWDFAEAKAALAGGTAVVVPPVWPGLANVTLGTAVTLVDGMTVTGPLDGVIVHITSVAPPTGFYPFGALHSFVHIGGIVFVDDNGQGEQALPLGLENDVVTPRSMSRAAHALVRVKAGTVGTIQPWIKT